MGDPVLMCVLRGATDANIRFNDLRALLARLGFDPRLKGCHHIFSREDVDEILNLHARGSLAKPYQVRQVRGVIIRYKMAQTP